MNASKAAASVDDTIGVLENVKQKLEDNDTYDFDIGTKLAALESTAIEVEEYIDDNLDS